MTRKDKGLLIEDLKEKFSNSAFYYITDASSMSVEQINKLRRTCFEKGIEIQTVKNTLAIKAIESLEDSSKHESIFPALKGQSTILFSSDSKLPATVLKEFRGKKGLKPALKAAYIDSDVFFGDDQLEALIKLKSKNELIGDVIFMLQSPAKNVMSALNSGGAKLAGLLKALEERGTN